MKFKIAVTDACIFIDIYDLELVNSFFKLELEIHTTTTVFYELDDIQRRVFKAYQSAGLLVIHNLNEADFIQIYTDPYPKSLSEADKSVLHIANKLGACVLSSDKVARNCAKNKDIEYHGMIWIFDKLVNETLLTKKKAAEKLTHLVSKNNIYQNNAHLVNEINKRLKEWGEGVEFNNTNCIIYIR